MDQIRMTFLIAASQYPIEALKDWETYVEKLERWVGEAVDTGAALLVFPEYGSMELAALDPPTMGELIPSFRFVAGLAPRVDALHAELAQRHGIHILAGSIPVEVENSRFLNRSRLFAPTGKVGVQDKLVMTRNERERWSIVPGRDLCLFSTSLGKIGVNICYDSEFPLLSRALVEAGAEILLVPSCTEQLQGYWRVRLGAQARALEGQFYAVQAPTVGTAPWSVAVSVNRGAAAIYAPPDRGFPDDGMVALGEFDAAQWLYAEIDPARVHELRTSGTVLNAQYWSKQPGAALLPSVQFVDLS